MRFLHIQGNGELSLVERTPDRLPPYAILSHTWGTSNEEVTYQDFLNGIGRDRTGYHKLTLCGRQAARDGFQYFWVDTCCIDKTSSAELSEAINSMYDWYQAAEVCYAYLADTKSMESLGTDKWFTRGWTLQELLAPQEVVFFDGEWNPLGTRAELREQVSERTRIPTSMLSRERSLETFSIAQRMSWAAERKTSRIEDIAYCMLGIFDINMPLIYGEGENAFIRLQEEIMKTSDDHSLFAWRSSDDRGGCLATSPASFRSSSNIIRSSSLNQSYEPATVSSKGVHLDVHFIGIGHGRLGCAMLNCCEESEDERIAIYLRDLSLTIRHLERVKTEDLRKIDFEAFASSQYPIRRLCIRKTRVKSKWNAKVYGEPRNALSMEFAAEIYSQEEIDIGSHPSLVEAVKTGLTDDIWLVLTRQDIDVNEELYNKGTALAFAAYYGQEETVQMLINRTDVRINTRDTDGRTPMWWAAENGHKAVVRLLLETGKVDVNSTDNNSQTPLLRVVQAGNKAVIKLLLGTGSVDVNLGDRNGKTPLLLAVQAGDEEVVKMLLGTGKVNANSWDEHGKTPLYWAVEKAVAAATATKENYTGEIEQRMAVIKLLLEIGKADANSQDEYWKTPLSLAAQAGDEAVIKLLLGTDSINVNSGDKNRKTPLSLAVQAGNEAVVKMLLGTGKANANSRDGYGRTPLYWAVEKAVAAATRENYRGEMEQRMAVIKLLLEIGKAEANSRESHGHTPLSRAVLAKNEPVIELLKTSMVDVSTTVKSPPKKRGLKPPFFKGQIRALLGGQDPLN